MRRALHDLFHEKAVPFDFGYDYEILPGTGTGIQKFSLKRSRKTRNKC
jgi:hypothetical protein